MHRSRLLPMLRSVLLPVLLVLALLPAFSASAPLRPSLKIGAPRVPPAVATRSPLSSEATSAGATGNWWSQARRDIERQEYIGSATEDGWQAPNRVQNLRTRFRSDGVELVPQADGGGAWRWRWETTAWGRDGSIRHATPIAPVSHGPRIEYRRSDLIEWYENRKEGLEQGFTLTSRPAGDGRLLIQGRVAAELSPRASDSGDAVEFVDEHGACVLRYGGLLVRDARGARLDARLSVAGGSLSIGVNDRGATYPITIDPLMTTAAWTTHSDQESAQFGWSVATAGDVNGDGYSDVIVGANLYDNGETDEGRAFVYLGSASGLAVTPAWTTESDQTGADLGICVATAGDVNGDGYSDVIVGADYYDNGLGAAGRAYVYLGSPSGLAATAAWTAESDQADARFGYAVATAGDVNGDGYSDVVVGAPFYDAGDTDEGTAHLYYGSPSGLAATAGWIAESDQAGANLGASVATAGDVNGDGYSDVIVGAVHFENTQTKQGRAYAYLGSASGLATAAVWMADGAGAETLLGFSVATAGDVNGDGYSDVIVGGAGYANPDFFEGGAFLYLGSASGLALSPAWTGEGGAVGALYGISVATAGDINGDGYADVIVGASQFSDPESVEGSAYVYLGSATGLATTATWTAESDQAGAYFGWKAATAGDVNGDGYSDVIVGAYGYDTAQPDGGQAYLYLGSASGLAPTAAWAVESDQGSAQLGSSLATAGDINGDGYSDIIVGAPLFDNGQANEGRAFVYLGSPSGLATVAAWTAESEQINAQFGGSVATAGDVNGDGYSDVIVGARMHNGDGLTDNGRAYVYLGSVSGLAATAAWTAESDVDGANFGYAVATAGDVNGDGYSDVIVGAKYYDAGLGFAGRAYVFLGSASGLAATAAWTADSDQADASFGHSVATAGDVNRDGYSDVIIGAVNYTDPEISEGRAFVYLGSSSGLAAAPAWSAEGDQTIAVFGLSVGTAGDVNGDGYSDIIVGAALYDDGDTNEGRAFVYLGSSSGPATTAAWSAESDQASAQFGSSVGTAGDVNGDGYSDVIVGAPYYDHGETDEGRAFVYLGAAVGLATTAAWTAESDVPSANLGDAVAAAGDVNGDGYSDAIIGAAFYSNGQTSEGRAILYYGNGGDGLDRAPRQYGSGTPNPLSLLGKAPANAVRLLGLGRSPAGRGSVRMEWEAKPMGIAFSASDHGVGSARNTGAPVPGIGSATTLTGPIYGLFHDTPYRWRFRILTNSPFFPRSPWFSLPYNSTSETDLRTGSGTLAVSEPATGNGGLRVEMIRPNPFSSRAVILYALPRTGHATLWIHDLQGRRVASLVDGEQTAGRHSVTWDGRDQTGRPVGSGVYWVRLRSGGQAEARRFVRD